MTVIQRRVLCLQANFRAESRHPWFTSPLDHQCGFIFIQILVKHVQDSTPPLEPVRNSTAVTCKHFTLSQSPIAYF